MGEFKLDRQALKDRARHHMERGAVTENYKGDREAVIAVLNQALATELVCLLRYKRHYFSAAGIDSEAVKAEFLQHANEEQQHIDWIATRIIQLNGSPDFNPEGLASRSHSEYSESTDLMSMLREDLYAERIAIESYAEVVRWLGDADPTSRRLMEDILKTEEEHAEDLKSLLAKRSL
jgi:bacterioferritin